MFTVERRPTIRPTGLDLDTGKCLPEIVLEAVCFYFDQRPVDVIGNVTRKKEIVQARHFVHYFLTLNESLSMNAIGDFTGKDHATVSNSRKTIEGWHQLYHSCRLDIHVIAFYINWLNQLDMEIQQEVSNGQIRYMYLLLDSLGIRSLKNDLVADASAGRTESVRELRRKEYGDLINHLEEKLKGARRDVAPHKKSIQSADRMRKRILSMCYSMGWTLFDPALHRHVADYERLEAWLLKYGYLHKPLDDYTYLELPTLVTQVENMMRSLYENKSQKS